MVVALVTITYYDFRYLRVGSGIMVFPFYYFGYYLKCRNIIPRILNHISCHQIKYVMLSLLLITISLYFTMLNVKVSTFSVNFGSFPIYSTKCGFILCKRLLHVLGNSYSVYVV